MILLFLAILFASLTFGAYLATRWAQAGVLHTSILAGEQRGWAVCDEAANAETGLRLGRCAVIWLISGAFIIGVPLLTIAAILLMPDWWS